MSALRWSVIEMSSGGWWAIDVASGTAYSLRTELAERLWSAHELQTLPLTTAMAADAAGSREAQSDDRSFVDLSFLGVTARYLCEEPATRAAIADAYAGAVPQLRRSPDVLVRVHHDANVERLHRSVVGPRDGAQFRTAGDDGWQPGSSDLPVIPPLQAANFLERYCALHAALLGTTGGGVIVCGAQQAGKTLGALVAERIGFGTVLADEMVLLDVSGNAWGVPLPIRERTTQGRGARAVRSTQAADGPALPVTNVVVLDTTSADPTYAPIVDNAERIRLVTPHMRVLDGTLGRATRTVLTLLSRARVWSWHLRPWPGLAEDLERGFGSVL